MSERGRTVSIDLGLARERRLVDVASGRVRTFLRVPLPPNAGRDELLARITGVAADVVEGAVDGVGVAVPGPFDYANGVCLLTHKLEPLHGVDLRRALADAPFDPGVDRVRERRGCVPARRGMGRCGTRAPPSGRVTLGTGLGSAFLEDGGIVDTGPCSVRRLAAPRSVPRPARRGDGLAQRSFESYGDPRLDVRDVAIRARNGDRRARRVFDELASALGEITAPGSTPSAPRVSSVGGSISQAWDLLGRGLHAALADVDGSEIVPAERVDDAALLGAARHAAATVARGARVGARQ